MPSLEELIAEVAGDDVDLAGALRERLGKNATAAQRFTGGFLRNSDYTAKTQSLAADRKKLEDQAKQYEDALVAAEAEKDSILKDLSAQRISTAQAQSLLTSTQQKYGLKDEDIPGMADLIATRKTGKVHDSTPEIDIDKRIADMKTSLMGDMKKLLSDTLVPELSAMASLDTIWDDINYDHKELFGKRLNREEKATLIADARKNNKSIETVWEDKYGVGTKRAEAHDADVAKKAIEKYEAEQAAKRTTEAMDGIREREFQPSPDAKSSVLKKNFRDGRYAEQQKEATQNTGTKDDARRTPVEMPTRDAEGRAEKLFESFARRQASGLVGKPEPVAKTA